MKFYDRTEEIAELRNIEQLSKEQYSCLTVVTGGRRIGKTSLIREAFGSSLTLYFFVSRDNESVLVKRFADEARTVLGIFVPEEISTFRGLFTLLMEFGKTSCFNLIIDEFQDFTFVNSAIYSHIQDVWDQHRKVTHINFVVCGSAYSMMNRIFEDRKEPLFGRRDSLIKLGAFPVSTLKEILHDYKTDYTYEDLLALYAFTGGVPKYVEFFMDKHATDKDQMIGLIAKSNSLLVGEGKNILIEEFGKEYGTYFSILGCLATGYSTQAEIEVMLGGVSIGGYLKRLQEDYSLISKRRPLGSPDGGKAIRYEISDIFLRFWFRYIHKNRSIVEIENWKLLSKIISDDYNVFTGDILERYFRQKMIESMNYRVIGNWWNPKHGEDPCEIDIIAVSASTDSLEVYEVKRNADKYDARMLQEKVDYFLSKNKPYRKYAVTIHGLSMTDM